MHSSVFVRTFTPYLYIYIYIYMSRRATPYVNVLMNDGVMLISRTQRAPLRSEPSLQRKIPWPSARFRPVDTARNRGAGQ